jgi:CubicO group peptidase (beta-lactamase class C family)
MEYLSYLPTLIFSEPRYRNVHSLLVSQQGETIFEGYFNGYDAEILHEAQSVTKSIQSLLVGIALDKKFIPSLDVKIKDYFPQYAHLDWKNGKDKITLRHLLTMTSGLQWNEGEVPYTARYQNDANLQIMHHDWIEYALSKPMAHNAGTTFAYSSASPILISQILGEATQLPNELFALHYLYLPLGISRYEYQQNKQNPQILADVDLLPADLLKIGQMVLQHGRFGVHQIVSPAWVQESLSPQVQFRTAGKSYGYMWWIDTLQTPDNESLAYYYAWGYGGQHIFLVPDYDLVMVTTGGHYGVTLAEQPFELLQKHILPNLKG